MMNPDEAVRLLDEWSEHGGEFPSYSHYWFSTQEEAEAIVRALEKGNLYEKASRFGSPYLFDVVACMQGAFDDEANEYLRQKALPVLRRIFNEAMEQPIDEEADSFAQSRLDDTHFFVLKNLAYYGDPDDAELIIKAADLPRYQDQYMWSHVLDYTFRAKNPAADRIIVALRDPLPTGFLRIAFLDFANALAFHSLTDEPHPFDNEAAVQWMLELFDEPDEGYDSYVVSATKSAPFLSPGYRSQILAKAESHPREMIRDEATWARARDPEAGQAELLVERCDDPRFATRAAQYLESLGREAEIPDSVKAPDFAAVVRLSDWLCDEQDFYGRPPDVIKLVDHRTLNWLPKGTRRELWLIQFECDGDERGYDGVGAVWDEGISIVTTDTEDDDLASAYAYLLGEEEAFMEQLEVDDPEELFEQLNPGEF